MAGSKKRCSAKNIQMDVSRVGVNSERTRLAGEERSSSNRRASSHERCDELGTNRQYCSYTVNKATIPHKAHGPFFLLSSVPLSGITQGEQLGRGKMRFICGQVISLVHTWEVLP